jgi:hypothetical protein
VTPDAETPEFDLREAMRLRQERLKCELGYSDVADHTGTKGDENELNWERMFRDFLPRRYAVSRAFVVDARGHRSQQIDLVVHDRHFSPQLFEIGNAVYIPAESVYAVFEVKQDISKEHLEYTAGKVASVRALHRTSAQIPHAGGKFPAIDPGRIIGGLLARRSSWKPAFGDSLTACLTELDRKDATELTWGLDLGCAVEDGCFAVKRDPATHTRVSVDVSPADVTLTYFVFQLLTSLQALRSVPAIDYDEYLDSAIGTRAEEGE